MYHNLLFRQARLLASMKDPLAEQFPEFMIDYPKWMVYDSFRKLGLKVGVDLAEAVIGMPVRKFREALGFNPDEEPPLIHPFGVKK